MLPPKWHLHAKVGTITEVTQPRWRMWEEHTCIPNSNTVTTKLFYNKNAYNWYYDDKKTNVEISLFSFSNVSWHWQDWPLVFSQDVHVQAKVPVCYFSCTALRLGTAECLKTHSWILSAKQGGKRDNFKSLVKPKSGLWIKWRLLLMCELVWGVFENKKLCLTEALFTVK